MSYRAIAFLTVLFLGTGYTALAGGDGDNTPPRPAPCRQGCNPAPRPQPIPQQIDLCNGLYQGGLANQPGQLTLELRQMDREGNSYVSAFWNGRSWMGQGFCQQTSPCQAEVQFQFEGTNLQRGVINYDANTGVAELEGQVFGGDSYRLYRQ